MYVSTQTLKKCDQNFRDFQSENYIIHTYIIIMLHGVYATNPTCIIILRAVDNFFSLGVL